jgi:hypothetical protein
MRTLHLLTISILLFLSGALVGQDTTFKEKNQDEMRTVFGGGDKKIDHGGYGAFTIGYTQIDNEPAMIIGGRAGWLIDHHFTLGLGGYGFFNNLQSNETNDISQNYTVAGGYGGLFVEAIIAPNFPVHASIPVFIGGGGATVYESSYWDDPSSNYYYNYDGAGFFVIEPGLELELNIVKFFRVALAGTYRWTSGVDLTYYYYDEDNIYRTTPLPRDILDGFSFQFTMKFGWF